MEIVLKNIRIRELVKDYVDNDEEGVFGYGGNLNIRPKYQREFIYKDKQRDAVIDTVKRELPLNVFYWSDNENGTFEVLDGQQRIISICQYVGGDFAVEYDDDGNPKYFDENLSKEKQDKFLNYELMVYFCTGTEDQKLNWFKTINIASEPLTDQELRNAIYSGAWVTDAKRYFSKRGCVAYQIAEKYLKGTCIRQDYLETAIRWINNEDIVGYMAKHQKDSKADPLWVEFQNIINWIKTSFPTYYKEMKGIEWGPLYYTYKNSTLNPTDLESKINKLMSDDEVTNKKGIWLYVLTGQKKHLNLRTFTDNQKRQKYEEQDGYCANEQCKKKIDIHEAEADHIKPWSQGGKTELDNCQILCMDCNRMKSDK